MQLNHLFNAVTAFRTKFCIPNNIFLVMNVSADEVDLSSPNAIAEDVNSTNLNYFLINRNQFITMNTPTVVFLMLDNKNSLNHLFVLSHNYRYQRWVVVD